MNKKTNDNRLAMATNIATGLLASQDAEKGWNIDTLAILSLKIADKIAYYNNEEKLPDLFAPKESDEKQA